MNNRFFCIIGAQRSSSTYLSQILDEHPEVTMARPLRPEPKFFLDEAEWKKGKQHYFAKHFSHANPGIILGEKSTSYYERPVVAPRIRRFFPEAKILIILRNPVARALSNVAFSTKNGLETRSLEDIFFNGVPPPRLDRHISVSPFAYIERSDYQRYLEAFEREFGRAMMKVLIMEEFVGSTERIRGVYSFLGADSTYCPRTHDQTINALEAYPPPPPAILEHLKTFFVAPIDALEAWLGRSLDVWRS